MRAHLGRKPRHGAHPGAAAGRPDNLLTVHHDSMNRHNNREVELRVKSTNITHKPMVVDLETTEFHVDGVAGV